VNLVPKLVDVEVVWQERELCKDGSVAVHSRRVERIEAALARVVEDWEELLAVDFDGGRGERDACGHDEKRKKHVAVVVVVALVKISSQTVLQFKLSRTSPMSRLSSSTCQSVFPDFIFVVLHLKDNGKKEI
jgi:hypothetical protein